MLLSTKCLGLGKRSDRSSPASLRLSVLPLQLSFQSALCVLSVAGFFLEGLAKPFFGRFGQALFQFDLRQAIEEVPFPGLRVCSKL